MWVGAHTSNALRGELRELRYELAVLVEQFLRLVALHPFFQNAHVTRLLMHLAHRYLVRAPIVLSAFTVDLLRAGPAFRRTEHDHRPARPVVRAVTTRLTFDTLDLAENSV